MPRTPRWKHYNQDGKRYLTWIDPATQVRPERWGPVPRKPPSRREILASRTLDADMAVLPVWARDPAAVDEMDALARARWRNVRDKVEDNQEHAMFVDEVDAPEAWTVTASYEWRTHAVKLAFERGLEGQAYRHPPNETIPNSAIGYKAPPGMVVWRCVSVHNPHDRYLVWNPQAGTIRCACTAGKYQRPCSHAGSVLLCVAGITSERQRDETGMHLRGV